MSAPEKRPVRRGHRRRSRCWRARIALDHEGVDNAHRPVDILRDRGEQRAAGA
ncbi:hypothetical protein WMF18_10515 [Sorangium sp. So ce315]|uniref:hypothetical protein n=1 Tax=Sorangium sp. So ce315 TaxID=3133299 RepID=UPI003F5F8984